jgi:hypothetical protein
MGATNTAELAALVRSVIERQVETTKSGKALTAYDKALVDNLVSNIGNLSMVIQNEIEETREAHGFSQEAVAA